MSIASEIERLNNAKAAIKASIENKGVEVADDAKLDSFPALIDNIEAGGGGALIPVEDAVYKARVESGTFYYLFRDCEKTVEIDLSGWDTSKITNIGYMFQNCKALTTLNMSGWDLSNVTTSYSVFSGCNALNHVTLNRSNFVTIDKIIEQLPAHADAPENDYVIDISDNDSETLRDISCIYDNYYNGWTIKGAYVVDSSQIVYTSSGETPATFTSTGLGTYTTSNVDNGDGTITTTIDFTNSPKQIRFSGNIVSLDSMDNIVLTNMTYTFMDCTSLQSIDLSNCNMSYVTDMYMAFMGCTSLQSIDLSNCNMSHVTNMFNTFSGCTSLEEINVNWDGFKSNSHTSRVFNNCASLTELDLSDWTITEKTSFVDMFAGCESLVKLDLSNWDILKGDYDTVRVFEDCNSLVELRLDNWSKDAISWAISSKWQLPTNAIEGKTRTIYCKESEAAELTPPINWVFSYV